MSAPSTVRLLAREYERARRAYERARERQAALLAVRFAAVEKAKAALTAALETP